MIIFAESKFEHGEEGVHRTTLSFMQEIEVHILWNADIGNCLPDIGSIH